MIIIMSHFAPVPHKVEPDPGVYNIKSYLTGANISLKGGEGATLTAS